MENPADLDVQEHTPTHPQLPVSKVLTLRTKAKFVINQHREQLYFTVPLLRVGSSVT